MNTKHRLLCLAVLWISVSHFQALKLGAEENSAPFSEDLPDSLARLIEGKHIDEDFGSYLTDRAQSETAVRAILQNEFDLGRSGNLSIHSVNVAKQLILRLSSQHFELAKALHDRCEKIDSENQLTEEQKDLLALEAADAYLNSLRTLMHQLVGSEFDNGVFAQVVSKRRMQALHHAALKQNTKAVHRMTALVEAGVVDLAELNEVEAQQQTRMLEAMKLETEIVALEFRFKRACQIPNDISLNCEIRVAESIPVFGYSDRLDRLLETSSMNPSEDLDDDLWASFKAEEEALFEELTSASDHLLHRVRTELPDSFARRDLLLREIGKSIGLENSRLIASLLRPMLDAERPNWYERALERNKTHLAETRELMELRIKHFQDRGELDATLYRQMRAATLSRLVEVQLSHFAIGVQLFETEPSRTFRFAADDQNAKHESRTRHWLTMELSREHLSSVIEQYVIVRERMFAPVPPPAPGERAVVNHSPIVRENVRAIDSLAKAQYQWFDSILRIELADEE